MKLLGTYELANNLGFGNTRSTAPATKCEAQHSKEVELLFVLKRCFHSLGRMNTKAREWTLTIMQATQVLSEDEGKERL